MIHRDNVWHPYYEIKVEEDDIGTRFKKNQDAKKEKDIDGAGVAAAMEQITNFDKAQKDQQEALESAQGPKKRIFDMNKIRQQKMQESAAGGAQDNKVQDYMSVRMSDIPGAMTEQDLKQECEQRFGAVDRIYMPLDERTERPRGFAVVTFQQESSVEKALDQQNFLLDFAEISIKPAFKFIKERTEDMTAFNMFKRGNRER